MQRANLQAAAADVAERIMVAPHTYALFLDHDGTLLDIAERPDAVRAAPGPTIDSGPTLDHIDTCLHPLRFDAAAEHGSERAAFGGPAQLRRWITTLAADLRRARGDCRR